LFIDEDKISIFWRGYDHGNQQISSFPKLHIKQLKQFEGFRIFTNFIEPLLQENELNNPGNSAKISHA
jgi:hypothetical protein